MFPQHVRRVALGVVLSLLSAFVHADPVCYDWTDGSGHTGTDSAVCSARSVDYGGGYSSTFTASGDNPAPTALGLTGWCDEDRTNPAGTVHYTHSLTLSTEIAASCPPPDHCAADAGKTKGLISVGGVSAPGASLCANDGCQYTSAPTAEDVLFGAGAANAIQQVVAVGSACGSPDSSKTPTPDKPSASKPACASSSGNIVCETADSGGKNCGTFNGDQICVAAIPPGSCVQYSSGGVACTESSSGATSPPAPDSGTSGVPASPTAVVKGDNGGTATVTDYYSSTVVSGSSNPTVAGAAGGTTNPNGSPTGAGTVTVAPNPDNGDCGAAGVNCSGSLPAADASDGTFSSVDAAFWSAIQGAPIPAAVSAIESAWPTGSCPDAVLHTTTFGSASFDYGTTMCTVWSTYAAPALSTTTLIVWALIAVFIVLSA